MVNWSNMSTFNDLLIQANTGAPFWTGMLFMVFAVFLISFLGFGFTVALIASGFIGFLLGLFLTYMGLVAWYWTLMLFGFMLLGIIYSIWSKKD